MRDVGDLKPIDFVEVGAGLLVFCAIVLLGLALALERAEGRSSWLETPCRIIEASGQQLGPSAGEWRVRFDVDYRYDHGGRSHEGRGEGRPRLVDPGWRRLELVDFVAAGGLRDAVDHGLVDPQDPSGSVFRYEEPDEIRRLILITTIAAAVFAAILVLGIVRGLRLGFR